MQWTDLVEYSETHNLHAKQLYVVFSTPTNGLGPVLKNLDAHVEYQTELETKGTMFAAGPFASEDLQEWRGDGMFIYLAESLAAATALAERDPMHSAGARSFQVRQWLLNEGTCSL
jgi:uncharacterized protein YciI